MIIDAVFNGQIDCGHITDDELFEIEDYLFELVCEQKVNTFYWDTLQ
jgi:hypothetical protein